MLGSMYVQPIQNMATNARVGAQATAAGRSERSSRQQQAARSDKLLPSLVGGEWRAQNRRGHLPAAGRCAEREVVEGGQKLVAHPSKVRLPPENVRRREGFSELPQFTGPASGPDDNWCGMWWSSDHSV